MLSSGALVQRNPLQRMGSWEGGQGKQLAPGGAELRREAKKQKLLNSAQAVTAGATAACRHPMSMSRSGRGVMVVVRKDKVRAESKKCFANL